MSFKYESVVPWGRSYDEYRRMFSLTDQELKKRILGCGDGPAAFNAVCNETGGEVVSIDPIYSMTEEQLRQRINETYDTVIAQTRENTEKFVWKTIRSVDQLGEIRMAAMNRFLSSYESGKREGRYISGSITELPFENNSFDIALSSHFLLLYTDNLNYEFHIAAINEMMRVAKEVRIFPILDVNAKRSPYVDRLSHEKLPYAIELKKVDYEFQLGGNQMMILRRQGHSTVIPLDQDT